jgi:uncharacterized protein
MNGFMPVEIWDRVHIEPILAKNPTQASEFTFAYLYMWQCDYGFQYVVRDGWLLIVSESTYDIPFALCPLPWNGQFVQQGFDEAVHWLRRQFAASGRPLVFGRVEEKRLPWFNGFACAEFTIERSDRTADYVYEAEALRELPGRKYGSKRNHISQFLRHHPDYEIVPVGEENLDECRRIIDQWCKARNCTCGSPESCEKYACNRMLDQWGKLDMQGILLRVDGMFEAFTIGELLDDRTVAIRYEKANGEIHGLYAILNRDFLQKFGPAICHVNREEDMGIEGLRKAKESYHPCLMIQKYTLFLQH